MKYLFSDDELNKENQRLKDENEFYKKLGLQIKKPTKKDVLLGKLEDEAVTKCEMLMNRLGLAASQRKVVEFANEKAKACGRPAIAIELHDGRIITGKRSKLFAQSAALLLNALKALAGINDEIPLLTPMVIEPIMNLKVESLKNNNPIIHAEEILIALAIQANTNPLANLALKKLPELAGCEAHASCMINTNDLKLLNKIGVRVTEEPISLLFKIN